MNEFALTVALRGTQSCEYTHAYERQREEAENIDVESKKWK